MKCEVFIYLIKKKAAGKSEYGKRKILEYCILENIARLQKAARVHFISCQGIKLFLLKDVLSEINWYQNLGF